MTNLIIIDPCLVPTTTPGVLRHADPGEIIQGLSHEVAAAIASGGRAKMFKDEELDAARARAAEIATGKPVDPPPADPGAGEGKGAKK